MPVWAVTCSLPMNLDAYLERISYSGPRAVDVETLRQIQKHHLLAIPYENVDVQLKRPLTTSVEAAFEKIVNQRRGGWCYEMNGLLGWALAEIGFDIQRTLGGVNRNERGDDAIGNHLVLLVALKGKTYVVDAGFGDGFLYPLPLEEGTFFERDLEFRLELMSDGFWRMHNHQFGGAPSFDFRTKVAEEFRLSESCEYLQHAEDYPFVKVLIVQRFVEGGYEIQVGRVSKRITADGVTTTLLDSSEQLVERLNAVFGLDVPEVATLWPVIVERHDQLFGSEL